MKTLKGDIRVTPEDFKSLDDALDYLKEAVRNLHELMEKELRKAMQ